VVESIGAKEFLNPTEAAKLLGVSRATMYRYMEQGVFKVLRTPARTIIRRSDIEALFDNPPAYIKRNNNKLNMLGETYSMLDITKKYNISKRVAESRIRKFDILKIMRGRNIFYRREDIHKYFEDFTIELDTDFYYNAEEIMEKYNMTHQAIVAFARRHEIPRIYRNRVTYYSKAHIDSVKTTGKRLDPNYYTRQEIMSRYHFTKEQVSYYLNTYHIERKKCGAFTLINREDFDRILRERMNGSISIAELNSKIDQGQEVREEKKKIEGPIEIVQIDDNSKKKKGDGKKENKIEIVTLEGYMSIEDIENHYKLSKGWVQYLTRKMRIPRVQKGRYLYYDKKIVTEIFSKYQSSEGITEWYTAEDIEKKFNMTPQARGGFTCKHKIPKKRESGVIYYSKLHVDFAKDPASQYSQNYYTVEQIKSIYNVSRERVYYVIRHYKIPSIRDGNCHVYLKSAIDKQFKKEE
jgi:transposase